MNVDAEVIARNLGNLSKQEMLERVKAESPELLDLLAEFRAKIEEVTQHILPLLERVKKGELPTNQGVSLLEVKNQLLLNYCLNLAFYFYLKADGKSVKDHPVIEKLLELRLYLEKLKPIEQKLRYQIDKLVKASVTGTSASVDPLQHRANPDNLASDDDGAAPNTDDEDDDNEAKYRAPKIAPMHFSETPDADERHRQAAERTRKKASTSRILREMMDEVTDAPEEVIDAGNNFAVGRVKQDRDWDDRVRAEEEMMTRLPMTRLDKKKMRQKSRLTNELSNLDDFDDFSYLNQALEQDESVEKRKKRAMRDIINSSMTEEKKRKMAGGDDDVPRREKKVRVATSGEDYNTHLDEPMDQPTMDEDAFYQEIANDRRVRKEAKEARHRSRVETAFMPEEEEPLVDGKRKVNYDILKNKGLTPKRSKEQRNPRVKQRTKYEKSLKKLKSFKAVIRAQDKAYVGEETGIKKNLARSVKF
jgi:hypothetical protein